MAKFPRYNNKCRIISAVPLPSTEPAAYRYGDRRNVESQWFRSSLMRLPHPLWVPSPEAFQPGLQPADALLQWPLQASQRCSEPQEEKIKIRESYVVTVKHIFEEYNTAVLTKHIQRMYQAYKLVMTHCGSSTFSHTVKQELLKCNFPFHARQQYYTRTPLKGHPWIKDTSLIRTRDQVPTSYKYIRIIHPLKWGHLPNQDTFYWPKGLHIREVPLYFRTYYWGFSKVYTKDCVPNARYMYVQLWPSS